MTKKDPKPFDFTGLRTGGNACDGATTQFHCKYGQILLIVREMLERKDSHETILKLVDYLAFTDF